MLSYLSLALGIIVAKWFQVIPPISWLLVLAAIVVFFLIRKLYLSSFYYWLFCCILFVTGFAYGELRQHFRDQQLLTTPVSGMIIDGYLSSPPETSGNWIHSDFKITSGSFSGHKIMLYYPLETRLKAGYSYQIKVSLKPLNFAGNFTAPNYSEFLIDNAISASAFTLGTPRELAMNYSISSQINRYRSGLIDYLAATLKPYPYAGLAIALISGYQKLIPTEQWQIYKNSGIVHIISISGLHITLVTTLVVIFLGIILKILPPLRIPKQIFLLWSGIIFALLYSLIAGFSIPCQRTFYLLLIMGYLTTRRIHLPLLQKLAMTLALVLIIDPFSAQSIGFWFSFVLVATIFTFQAFYRKTHSKIFFWLYLQITMALVSLPLSLYFFSYYPLTSIIGNLWAVPLLGNLITPLLLIAGIAHWDWLLIKTTELTTYIVLPLNYLAKIPPYWQTHPNFATILLAFCGIVLIILPKLFYYQRLCGLILFLTLFVPQQQERPFYQETRMVTFSNEKAGYTLLETSHHNLLLVTSNQPQQIDKQFNYTVLPYLRNEHITIIDYLLSNYPDESGLINILKDQQIQIINNQLEEKLKIDGVEISYNRDNNNHWLIYTNNQGLNYLGDGSKPEIAPLPNFSTITINFPLSNTEWLYTVNGINLLVNYPQQQRQHWQSVKENLNLKFKNIYDLTADGSVVIFESKVTVANSYNN